MKKVPVCGGYELKVEICRTESKDDPTNVRDVLAVGIDCNSLLKKYLNESQYENIIITLKGFFYVSATSRPVEGTKRFKTEICDKPDLSDWFSRLTNEEDTACS